MISKDFPSSYQERQRTSKNKTKVKAAEKKMVVFFKWFQLGVSLNGGTPQIIHFNRVFHYKPSILGYHYFRKPPIGASLVHVFVPPTFHPLVMSEVIGGFVGALVGKPQHTPGAYPLHPRMPKSERNSQT